MKKKRSHSVRTAICKLCGKSFADPSYLKTHISVVHEGRKDYKCNSCDKSFPLKVSLKIHIQDVHENSADLKCDYCGKLFNVKEYLKQHIRRIHETQKEYKCDMCSEILPSRSEMYRHVREIHYGQTELIGKSNFSSSQSLELFDDNKNKFILDRVKVTPSNRLLCDAARQQIKNQKRL